MIMIVIRSKLVIDFTLTTHFLHLLVVSFYTGQVPQNLFWWLTMAVSSAAGVMLGIWGCQYRELRPVFFGGGSTSTSNNNNKTSQSIGGNANGSTGEPQGEVVTDADGVVYGDEEQGFSRGRGRGRGRDGAGEYEMVKMNGAAAP